MQITNEEMETLNRASEVLSKYANQGNLSQEDFDHFDRMVIAIIDGIGTNEPPTHHKTDVKPEANKAPSVFHKLDDARHEGRNGTVDPITDIEDIKRVIHYFTERKEYRNRCLFYVAITVGLRPSDLLFLKVLDVAYSRSDGTLQVMDAPTIRIGEENTNKCRVFSIPPDVCNEIQRYLDHAGLKSQSYLFPSRHGSHTNSKRKIKKSAGEPLDVDSFQKIMKRVQRDLDLPYNLGALSCRKTYAYHFFEQHRDDVRALAYLQYQLKDSNSTSTLRYIGLDKLPDKNFDKDFNFGFCIEDIQ